MCVCVCISFLVLFDLLFLSSVCVFEVLLLFSFLVMLGGCWFIYNYIFNTLELVCLCIYISMYHVLCLFHSNFVTISLHMFCSFICMYISFLPNCFCIPFYLCVIKRFLSKFVPVCIAGNKCTIAFICVSICVNVYLLSGWSI